MLTQQSTTAVARSGIAAAALLWASAGIAASLAPAGTTGAALALCRLVLGGLALAALCGPRRLLGTIAVLPRGPLAAAALAMALFQWSFFAAIPGAGAGAAALLSAGAGPFFAELFDKAQRMPRRWLPRLCCIGAALAILCDGQASFTALMLAIVSGAAYAAYACAAARLGEGGAEHSLAVTAIALLAAGASLLPLAGGELAALATTRGAAVAAYLGLFATALAYRVFVPAMLRLGPGRSLALLTIQPVAALLGAWLMLGDVPGAGELAAAALLGTGELLRAAHSRFPTHLHKERST